MKKISIITPTKDRHEHLRLLYEVIKAQTYQNWEWLIYDDSWKNSDYFANLNDNRVNYHYEASDVTIGMKRNELIKKSTGELIVHFDDDDYYSPIYLAYAAHCLEKYDLFHLNAWFCLDSRSNVFFYWETSHMSNAHYRLNPVSEIATVDLHVLSMRKRNIFTYKKRYGYGFSYGYKKGLTEKFLFKDINLGEDYQFMRQAIKNNYPICSVSDEQGLAIHVTHDVNMSIVYPQYKIPSFMLNSLFPECASYFLKYPQH